MKPSDADILKQWVRELSASQLLALWRWITLEYMQRCREEAGK